VIEITDWARDILARSHQAARRFHPSATIRLARIGGRVEAAFADSAQTGDQPIDLGDFTVFAQAGLEGLVDVEEPHDRLVLRELGSPPNVRRPH
jgi:hypothetical protein